MQEENKQSSVKGFGAKLRGERESREVTLEEISRVTKISIHILHAMENDEWASLPGGIFTRNFIRLYANHLGLESERWVDDFQRFIKIKNKAEGIEEQKEKASDSPTFELPRKWIVALVIVTIIAIVGGYLGISYLRDTGSIEQQSETDQVPQSQPENLPSNLEQNAIVEELEQEQVYEGLEIELTEENSSCWFQWWADGELQSPPDGERIEAGTPRTLRAVESINLNIAHLNGVRLVINGQEVEWQTFSPRPRQNESGTVISYIVQISRPE